VFSSAHDKRNWTSRVAHWRAG